MTTSPASPAPASPFHAGEQRLQQRVGMHEKMQANGHLLMRDYMPEQHRQFFAQLPWILIGGQDKDGLVWASMLCGTPGFITTPTAQSMEIQASFLSGDPLRDAFNTGSHIGLLGIELHTRRRNRLNGHMTHLDQTTIKIAVDRSFGNCPKYIQQRDSDLIAPPASMPAPEQAHQLDAEAITLIEQADTFFIATHAGEQQGAAGNGGADVSHRGGKPGFIRVDRANTLTWPDFSGNYFFNTLGNIELDPRAGLLIPDFTNGDLLYLSGHAVVIWDGAELDAFAGAQRLVRFEITQMRRLRARMPLRWTLLQQSPHVAPTGDWNKRAS